MPVNDAVGDLGLLLDRPYEPGEVFVPSEVEIIDGKLLWRMFPHSLKTPKPSILNRFRMLHRQSDSHVLAFVKSFGVALFCKHHLPVSHSQIPYGQAFGMEGCWPAKVDGRAAWYEETVGDYIRFSEAADAIINAAAAVNSGEIPSDETLTRFAYAPRALWMQRSLGEERPAMTGRAKLGWLNVAKCRIAEEVNLWIAISQTHPEIEWDRVAKQWRHTMRHSPWGVLGAVGQALMTTIPQLSGWRLCSICGDSFSPSRTPAVDRFVYCNECRRTRKWAFLKRIQRSKKEKN